MTEITGKLTFILDAKNNVDKTMKDVQSSMGKIQDKVASMKPAFTAMAAVGTAAFGAIAFEMKKAIDASQEAAKVQAQLTAVLESTGYAAGITAERAIELSRALQKESTFGDEAILSAENLLLTFTKIKDDIFPDATRIVLDMSTALGQDLQSSAIQVGKALQDPILGASALRRVGVNFNEAQQEVIKNLVETGRAAEAQQMIIKELTTEFGGSAAAQTETFAGKMQMLKERIGDIQESIGNILIPILTDLFNKISPVIDKVAEWIEKNPELTKNILIVGAAISGMVAVIGVLGLALPGIITGFGYLGTALTALMGLIFSPGGLIVVGIMAAIAAIYLLWKNWDTISAKIGEICGKIGDFFKGMGEKIREAVNWIIEKIAEMIGTLQDALEGVAEFILHPVEGIKKAISAMSSARESIGKSIGSYVENTRGLLTGERTVESEYITSRVWPTTEPSNQNVFNFEFNGDITDKDSLIKNITEQMNRQAELIGIAGK
ncbi:MAG: phage tail tape measure protein [Candidatus Pacebacteria bacterium]|nr:phage tail tape measure protein [Candidatus Paceibacterota bacterium]